MTGAGRIVLGIVVGLLLASLPFLHARYGLASHEHAAAIERGDVHAHHTH